MSPRSIARSSYAAPAVGVAIVVTIGMALIARMSLAASGIEPARLRVSAALIDETVRHLLPIDLVLLGGTGGSADGGVGQSAVAAVLGELRYCGVTERGAGRFRAVIRTGTAGGSMAPLLLGEDACRAGLSELARRSDASRASDDEVTIADVDAVWYPWQLRLMIARSVGGPWFPKPGLPRPLAAVDNRRDLLGLSTAGLRIVTGMEEVITVHVAPSFVVDAVEVWAILGESGAAPPAVRPGAGGTVAATAGEVNVSADLPNAFINQVLRQLSGARPIAIPIDRDVVDIQNLSVTGVGAGLMVAGVATPRSIRESVRLSIHAAGGELRVASVRVDAQVESCNGLGVLATIGCTTRNAARNAAAAAFGSAITQRYQGATVHELAGPLALRLDIGMRRLELRGDLLHLGTGGRSLAVGAHLTHLAGEGQGH